MNAFSAGHLPLPASSSSPSPDRPNFIDAIELTRQHSVPEVLKRALYEILSSAAFWHALDSAMSGKCSPEVLSALSVAGKDQYRLVSAREKFRIRWRDFFMEARGHAWCCQECEETQKGRWRSFVFEKGGLEVVDPVRYAFVAEWGTELRENKKWCQGCLERKTWEEKRVQGWSEMDKIFGL